MAFLEFTKGKLQGKSIPLEGEATLGRLRSCTIPLEDDGVSRRHARILAAGESFQLEDLESRNGTFVNGARVASAVLAEGDEVRIGESVFLFRDPTNGEAPPAAHQVVEAANPVIRKSKTENRKPPEAPTFQGIEEKVRRLLEDENRESQARSPAWSWWQEDLAQSDTLRKLLAIGAVVVVCVLLFLVSRQAALALLGD